MKFARVTAIVAVSITVAGVAWVGAGTAATRCKTVTYVRHGTHLVWRKETRKFHGHTKVVWVHVRTTYSKTAHKQVCAGQSTTITTSSPTTVTTSSPTTVTTSSPTTVTTSSLTTVTTSSPTTTTATTTTATQTTSGGGLSRGVQVGAGSNASCALLSDGSVDCWGYNNEGELGTGSSAGPDTCGAPYVQCSKTPVPVLGIRNATAIGVGGLSSCALESNGRIRCWGGAWLGNGVASGSATPVAVTGITDAASISVGERTSCALLSGGSIDCWGNDEYGYLGNGGPFDVAALTPVPVIGITNATAISAGSFGACALLAGGNVDCWGFDGDGALGNGGFPPGGVTSSATPVPVSGITNAIAISAGGFGACALLSGGNINCWGYDADGELGNGTTTGPSSGIATPVPVSGITNAIAISAGSNGACALLSDSSLDCWGTNLGNGTTISSATPVPVSGITNATAISAGGGSTCVLLSGGNINCWGINYYGQLGNGTTVDSLIPVPVSGIS